MGYRAALLGVILQTWRGGNLQGVKGEHTDLVLEGCCLRPSCRRDARALLFLTLSLRGILLGPQK